MDLALCRAFGEFKLLARSCVKVLNRTGVRMLARNRKWTMASGARPGPAFVAPRGAAALSIDDLSRKELREWLLEALDHRGQFVEKKPEPTETGARTIVAAVGTLTDAERLAFRRWVERWTDWSGRLIAPHEHRMRLAEIRSRHDQAATSKRGQ